MVSLSELAERALLRLIVLLGQRLPTLTGFLEQTYAGLPLTAIKDLLGATLLQQVCLLGQTELKLTG